MTPFENNLSATCKEEDAAKALQEKRVLISQSELEELQTNAANDSKLILELSKKLEMMLNDNEDLREGNDRLVEEVVRLNLRHQNSNFPEAAQAAPVSSTAGEKPAVSADAAVNNNPLQESTLQSKTDEVFPEAAQAAPISSTEGENPAVSADAAVNNMSLAQMVAGVMGNDPPVQTECTRQFRRLLTIDNPPIKQVVDSGVVPRFIEFLQRDENHAIQFEAAWVLTNIVSGTCEDTKVVVDAGAIPIFVRLLLSSNDDVREQAIWALGNIAGDSPPRRDLVLQAGAMQPLLQQLHQNSKLSMLRNATWTLMNFCRGKPKPDFNMVKPSLAALAQLIFSPDEVVLTDACWALSYLSEGPNEKIQAVIEAGVCRRLVELLLNPSSTVQTPALRTIGNIVTGDDLQTQVIINNNALPCLLALLSSPKKGIRKDACWTISNITAGSKDQIQAVIDNNIVPSLIQLLTNADFDVRKEAAWAILNATTGSASQIRFLVQQGCIRPLCDLLAIENDEIIFNALKGLENILVIGNDKAESAGQNNDMAASIANAGGFAKIKKLQQSPNSRIQNQCTKVLDAHFRHQSESF